MVNLKLSKGNVPVPNVTILGKILHELLKAVVSATCMYHFLSQQSFWIQDNYKFNLVIVDTTLITIIKKFLLYPTRFQYTVTQTGWHLINTKL